MVKENVADYYILEKMKVVENSENFEHSSFCTNQVHLEERVYDFGILNSRDKQAIRKEKSTSTPTLTRRVFSGDCFSQRISLWSYRPEYDF